MAGGCLMGALRLTSEAPTGGHDRDQSFSFVGVLFNAGELIGRARLAPAARVSSA